MFRPFLTSFRAAGPGLYNVSLGHRTLSGHRLDTGSRSAAKPASRQFTINLMLYYLILTVYVIVCLVLMMVVLLQQGKGGDIANAFGGGSSQAAFGARSGATVLSRATTVCAVLFVLGAIVLGILGQSERGSVIGGRQQVPSSVPAPAGTTPPPAGATAPAPTTPAPAK
jgi:preprotein translocase subunit SecG